MEPAVPNGEFRIVKPDELFFSTTDRKGIILRANSVFARLSQYPRDVLMGAPHNIIRHPEMPGGAFHIMWDMLLSDKPMAAYVKNLAQDGFTYWVFATITPVKDGFLSVRTAPCHRPLWETVNGLYNTALGAEWQARQSGMNRAEAARIGAGVLANEVKGLGFPSYEDFIQYALPLETAARIAASSRTPHRPDITGDLGQLLVAVEQINAQLEGLLGRLDALQELADALAAASAQALMTIASLAEATDMATAASESVRTTTPVLGRAAAGMAAKAGEVSATIEKLAHEMDDVRRWVLQLRFRIGLTRLHNDMVTLFAIEVADGKAPPEGLTYVPVLCEALDEDVRAVSVDMVKASSTFRDVSAQVEAAGEQLREVQRGMATWRLLVPRYQMSRQLDPYVAPIDHQLHEGHSQMARLRELAALCSAQAQPFDPDPLHAAITTVDRVSRAIPVS